MAVFSYAVVFEELRLRSMWRHLSDLDPDMGPAPSEVLSSLRLRVIYNSLEKGDMGPSPSETLNDLRLARLYRGLS